MILCAVRIDTKGGPMIYQTVLGHGGIGVLVKGKLKAIRHLTPRFQTYLRKTIGVRGELIGTKKSEVNG